MGTRLRALRPAPAGLASVSPVSRREVFGQALSRRLALAFVAGFAAGCGGGGGGGKPFFTEGGVDLSVDKTEIEASWQVVDRYFPSSHCAVVEGIVPASGLRRLLRFDTVVVNHGTVDLVLGSPTSPEPPLTPADFVFSPCHGHYHFTGFAEYRLEDLSGTLVAAGHKQAFCLEDSLDFTDGRVPTNNYDCDTQGITSGWADLYDRTLDGQWIDVTGIPAGDYVLVVTVNAAGKVPEVDVFPNTERVDVRLHDPAGAP